MTTPINQQHTSDDAALVRLFQQGDNKAFDELMARYEQALKIYAHTLLRNTYTEKEVIQCTWVRIMLRLQAGHYTEQGKFERYLKLTLQRIALASHRKTKTMVSEKAVAYASQTMAGDEHLENYDNRMEQVQKSLLSFNNTVRFIVHEHVIHERKFKDIGRDLSKSTGYVSKTFSRTVKALRKRLNKKPVSQGL